MLFSSFCYNSLLRPAFFISGILKVKTRNIFSKNLVTWPQFQRTYAVSQGLDQVFMLWSSVDYYKMLLHETYVNMFVEYMKIILVIIYHIVKNVSF